METLRERERYIEGRSLFGARRTGQGQSESGNYMKKIRGRMRRSGSEGLARGITKGGITRRVLPKGQVTLWVINGEGGA